MKENDFTYQYSLKPVKIQKCYLIIIISRVFTNGLGDQDQTKVIPRTQKMVLDAALLNTQHYKVRIKGKVEQSRERSSAFPYTSV